LARVGIHSHYSQGSLTELLQTHGSMSSIVAAWRNWPRQNAAGIAAVVVWVWSEEGRGKRSSRERLRLNALWFWEGTSWVVSAVEESVFQGGWHGKFMGRMVGGHIFDSENRTYPQFSGMPQASLSRTGRIIGFYEPRPFHARKQCYSVLFL
jgi:hypothetical protein